MPRKSRIDAPAVLHHVTVRGIEGIEIFRSDADRSRFLKRLEKVLYETETPCFAWVLTPNRFLLRTGRAPISEVMRRLLTGYALWFNRKHHRFGQVFHNRFKPILCQEDGFFHELVPYIHLKPIRIRLVKDLNELGRYKYCGYSVVMGKVNGNGTKSKRCWGYSMMGWVSRGGRTAPLWKEGSPKGRGRLSRAEDSC
jgi:putative transposase